MADVPIYSREALVRDLINTISGVEGRPIYLGSGGKLDRVDRAYVVEVTDLAISVVNELRIKTA